MFVFFRTFNIINVCICFSAGVSVLAIGVSNADMEELNKIAAPTSYKNIFYSPTFDDFPSIEREFINVICNEEVLSEFKLNDEVRHIQGNTISFLLYYTKIFDSSIRLNKL